MMDKLGIALMWLSCFLMAKLAWVALAIILGGCVTGPHWTASDPLTLTWRF